MSDTKVIPDRGSLAGVVSSLRTANKTIAFTNGCFDLLHVGHLRSLESARQCADCLIVGINSDESTRKYKGEGHPIVPEDERAEMLAGLSCVDYVFAFDDPTVDLILEEIRPDSYCKGPEYDMDNLPERETLKRIGGKLVAVGDPKNHSTTSIIEKVVELHASD